MIILTDTETEFNKVQQDKILKKQETKERHLSIIKATSHLAALFYTGKAKSISPKIWSKTGVPTLPTLIQ